MSDLIPHEIKTMYQKVENEGFEIYIVGGSVRDLLMNRPVNDWDFTTNAKPEEILELFPTGFYDNIFGTVGVPIELGNQKKILEITTYRTEGGYSDRRRPDKVEWGKTVEEDLARRDFTINAIALKLPDTFIDPYRGKGAIEKKVIKAVGDPQKRFKEDALRLMRAVRLATELSFTIDVQTWNELVNESSLINEISKERIRIELSRILGSDHPYEGIMLLKNSGLLHHIIPELLEGIGVSQVRPGRHHTTDVFTHNLLSLKHSPSQDPIVRLATLLHDIGKPKVASTDKEGFVIFHNHEIVGAKIAYDISQRLKLSKKEREKIVTLIRWHMFTVDEKTTDASIRRFIRRVGVENIKDMIDLRIADRLGSGVRAQSWRLNVFKKRIEEQLQPAPFSINDMAVDGHDIMQQLGIKPGPKVGEILKKLFEEVDEDLSKNNKDYLLKRILELA